MPGMNSGPSPASPILVNAFRSALLSQWAIVALIFVLLLIIWAASRTAVYGGLAKTVPTKTGSGAAPAAWREPRARRLLRVGFGIIWLFDGILQAQPQMAGGLADQVIKPAAATSPGWVQHLVGWAVNLWDLHPIQAGAASVWIQVGIGLWMLFAVRGWSSRLAGLAGVAWGLIVWAFGEAFGGIFAPGLTVLFGAPGAVLIYVLAGALLALPERAWDTPRLGRLILGGMGAFFLGMALLQAWPGRGYWQGSLSGMIQTMAGTSQPHALEVLVSGFGNFTAAHGFAVNLVAVVALALLGAGLTVSALRSDARLARVTVIAGAVFCLADWLLVEDLGFLGGLGTDPNSMVPLILMFTAGYLGLAPGPTAVPAVAAVPATAAVAAPDAVAAAAAAEAIPVSGLVTTASVADSSAAGLAASAPTAGPQARQPGAEATSAAETPLQAVTAMAATGAAVTAKESASASTTAAGDAGEGGTPPGPGRAAGSSGPEGSGAAEPMHAPAWAARLLRGFAAAPLRVVAGIGAVGVILVGAAPMAFASVNHNADPITAEAIAGTNGQLDSPAPGFTLTSQDGRQVSLASLRGKVVLLTFLDPVCTTDCPTIAREMLSADDLLGAKASDTELVAVAANPTYNSVAYTRAFTSEEGLDTVPNWLFLTGSLGQLDAVWHHYGIEVENLPAGAMSAHNDLAFVISASGNVRQEISDDPGPGTSVTISSFAGLLANSVRQTMAQG
jgi:cytochrome oxidase Cu insertion factor (SCO1/SenC/PrrC family)